MSVDRECPEQAWRPDNFQELVLSFQLVEVSHLSCSVQSKQAGSGGDLGDPPTSASLAALLEDSDSIPSTHMMMPYRHL